MARASRPPADRRLLLANDRVAHVSLRGQVTGLALVDGERTRIAVPLIDLCATPGGPRDRQLLAGTGFMVIERRGGYAFGRSARDGYVGWVSAGALGPDVRPTHAVSVRATHGYAAPDIRAAELALLSLGAEVAVTAEGPEFFRTASGWLVPRVHLRPVDQPCADPVAVAELLEGTPYLWGGNSSAGIDCSGLVQAGCHGCGVMCPGDSDQQREGLGTLLPADAVLRRGDVVFWRGHVALMTDAASILHANAFTMSVSREPLAAATARIAGQGGGGVLARRRTG